MQEKIQVNSTGSSYEKENLAFQSEEFLSLLKELDETSVLSFHHAEEHNYSFLSVLGNMSLNELQEAFLNNNRDYINKYFDNVLNYIDKKNPSVQEKIDNRKNYIEQNKLSRYYPEILDLQTHYILPLQKTANLITKFVAMQLVNEALQTLESFPGALTNFSLPEGNPKKISIPCRLNLSKLINELESQNTAIALYTAGLLLFTIEIEEADVDLHEQKQKQYHDAITFMMKAVEMDKKLLKRAVSSTLWEMRTNLDDTFPSVNKRLSKLNLEPNTPTYQFFTPEGRCSDEKINPKEVELASSYYKQSGLN